MEGAAAFWGRVERGWEMGLVNICCGMIFFSGSSIIYNFGAPPNNIPPAFSGSFLPNSFGLGTPPKDEKWANGKEPLLPSSFGANERSIFYLGYASMGGGWLIAAAFRRGAGAPSLTSGFFGGAVKAPPNRESAGLELAVVLLKTPEVWLLNMEEVEGLGAARANGLLSFGGVGGAPKGPLDSVSVLVWRLANIVAMASYEGRALGLALAPNTLFSPENITGFAPAPPNTLFVELGTGAFPNKAAAAGLASPPKTLFAEGGGAVPNNAFAVAGLLCAASPVLLPKRGAPAGLALPKIDEFELEAAGLAPPNIEVDGAPRLPPPKMPEEAGLAGALLLPPKSAPLGALPVEPPNN